VIHQSRRFAIALQHHAEGLTFEQIGVIHKLSTARVYQLYRASLVRLNILTRTKNITAQELGLAIQRYHFDRERLHHGNWVGTPEGFQHELACERRRDEDNRIYGEYA
jgi:hypothetical protein